MPKGCTFRSCLFCVFTECPEWPHILFTLTSQTSTISPSCWRSESCLAYRSLATAAWPYRVSPYVCVTLCWSKRPKRNLVQIYGTLFSCTDVSFLYLYSTTSSLIGFPEFKSVSPRLSKTTVLCLGSLSLHSGPELLQQKSKGDHGPNLVRFLFSGTLVTHSDISFITKTLVAFFFSLPYFLTTLRLPHFFFL